jgi:2-oxoisovalerate dehydrogenase E1 component alpha subunit
MAEIKMAGMKTSKQKSEKPAKHLIKKTAKSVKKSMNGHKTETLPLAKDLLRNMHELMVKSRVLEERLIKIYKAGKAYFWIGAPGEEAFGVPLGLNVNKGQGPDHDYLHLHYRGTPTLLAMGMEPIDSIRIMMNRSTDTSTGGRNFSNHYCYPQWNVTPVSSPIEVQYSFAIGTAWVQHRKKANGITVVTGGDAGSAEGDFASCLIWSSRPGNELPLYITVQNNKWGISTSYDTQHGEKYVSERGKAFGIRTNIINGNDPIECYLAIRSDMEYIRKTGKPVLAEFMVSRLYGHSSASGANFINTEVDPVKAFEEKLLKNGVIKESETKELWLGFENEFREIAEQVSQEPAPTPESIWDNIYANNENADWRKF